MTPGEFTAAKPLQPKVESGSMTQGAHTQSKERSDQKEKRITRAHSNNEIIYKFKRFSIIIEGFNWIIIVKSVKRI